MARFKSMNHKLKKSIQYLIYLTSAFIVFRSITRGISDYDSYRTAGILITNEIIGINSKFAYDPSWGTFGTRSGNGPIWNIFLSPLQVIPYKPAILIVRFMVIVIAIILVTYLIKKFNANLPTLIGLCFILLLFPFRYLFNTSQGASIAFSLGTLVILLSLRNKIKLYQYIFIGFALVLCLNYKPHLFLPLIVWYLANRKLKILFSTLIAGLFCEIILIIFAPNSTQIAWGHYLIARSKAIDTNSKFELTHSPFAFIYQFLNLTTFIIYFISFIFLCLMFFYFYRLKFKFETGIYAMSIGVFIGPYSPTHDQILIAILYGVFFLSYYSNNNFNPIIFIPLILWIYPSEYGFLKLIFLLFVYNLILVLQMAFKNLVYFNTLIIVVTIIFSKLLSTGVIYQITGLGALFAFLIITKYHYPNLNNRNL